MMCKNCGAYMLDDATVCPGCGAPVEKAPASPSTLATVAKIFMILGTVFNGIYILPLIWCIPMTVHYNKCIKEGKPVSVGFKVCALLFVSLIGGILMLCDNDQ